MKRFSRAIQPWSRLCEFVFNRGVCKLKILIVDDDEDIRVLYQAVLQSAGHEVVMAANGREALRVAAGNRPGLILADIMMPEMDGFQFCRMISRDEALRDIPVVLMTASCVDDDDRQFAMDVGACRYMLKPMDARDFAVTVSKLIAELGSESVVAQSLQQKKTTEELDAQQYSVLINKLHRKVAELERTNRELQLNRAELQRMSTVISQTAESIIVTDQDGIIQYVNPGFEKVSGYSGEEVVGKKPSILKSGRQDDAFYEDLWKTIKAGKVWTGHFVNRRQDGSLYEQDASISPIINGAGEITNYVAVKNDVTDKIRLENQLRQAQKMESLGTLAGGIAHDFNNILTIILGYADIAQSVHAEGSSSWNDLREIKNASNRARELVKQILTFSRFSEQERSLLKLKALVREDVKLLRATIPTSIEIRADIDADCGSVLADANQMHQVIMNLCSNAYQAMRSTGGELSISLAGVHLTEGRFIGDVAVPADDYVRLQVRDSGTGIDKAVLERVFEPYFTTREKGEGTGLGLAVVHGIVKAHHGYITVESEVGRGTCVNVYFPRFDGDDKDVAQVVGVSQAEVLPHGTEHILLVDDEKSVVEVERRILTKLGYQITPMQSSREAFEFFSRDPARFDLMITDMSMPEMTGAELSTRILAIRPDLPIVLCTGFNEEIDEKRAKEMGIRKFILKPPSHGLLARTIREALDEQAGPDR